MLKTESKKTRLNIHDLCIEIYNCVCIWNKNNKYIDGSSYINYIVLLINYVIL
jgi:hypothetical protein